MLQHNLSYSDSKSQVSWQGKSVENQDQFNDFLAGPTRERLFDAAQHNEYEAELRALATTEMASDTIAKLLSSEPVKESWEVGEALAECLLEEGHGLVLPWNSERDKRTPKASLPGADLVGFIEEDEDAFLALGEIKTSSDLNSPPNVMNGKSGMIHQLDNLATNISI